MCIRDRLYPAELQTHFNIPFSKGSPYFYGKAGDGNRTHVSSLEGWCSTIEPVSYTHLDVYKRQDIHWQLTADLSVMEIRPQTLSDVWHSVVGGIERARQELTHHPLFRRNTESLLKRGY